MNIRRVTDSQENVVHDFQQLIKDIMITIVERDNIFQDHYFVKGKDPNNEWNKQTDNLQEFLDVVEQCYKTYLNWKDEAE